MKLRRLVIAGLVLDLAVGGVFALSVTGEPELCERAPRVQKAEITAIPVGEAGQQRRVLKSVVRIDNGPESATVAGAMMARLAERVSGCAHAPAAE